MLRHIRYGFLFLLIGFNGTLFATPTPIPTPPEQAAIPSICHIMPATKYRHIESDWRWHDADTLIFSVSPGYPPNSIFYPTNTIVWYQYHPSNNQLEELNSDPYQDISKVSALLTTRNDIQADGTGSFRTVAISPTGDAFVYPRTEEAGGGYWYLNSKTSTQIDVRILAVAPPNHIPLETFWSANGHRFIIQNYSNLFMPIKIVTVKNQQISIQALVDLPPFSAYGEGFWLSNFRVMGISTDGQYILIQPETMDNVSWLYNLDTQQLSAINFRVYGQSVIWLNATTFMARTDMGVVEYDIQTQTTHLSVPSKFLVYSWSPDGRFLLGTISDQYGMPVSSDTFVCQIRPSNSIDTPSTTGLHNIIVTAWSPDGRKIAVGGTNGFFQIRDNTGQILHSVKGLTSAIVTLDWSPDSTKIITGSDDGTVSIWDANNGQQLVGSKGYNSYIRAVDWSPDGKQIIISGSSSVSLWDGTNYRFISDYQFGEVYGTTGLLNKEPVVFTNMRGILGLYTYSVMSPIVKISIGNDVIPTSWSGHDSTIAVGTSDGNIKIYSRSTGQLLATYVGHSQPVDAMSFSPNGQVLASASSDGTIRAWNVATGQQIASFVKPKTTIKSIDWSPDGSKLAFGKGETLDIVSLSDLSTPPRAAPS